MSEIGKPRFYLNLPALTREYTQTCELCGEDYETKHRQQRYCGQKRDYLDHKCLPLTASQKRHGITNELRRGGKCEIKHIHPNLGKKRDKSAEESFRETQRKYLSMKLG